MNLTSTPATKSIINAISRQTTGVNSAVNDSTQLVGGTLEIAVIGSIFTSTYATRLTSTIPANVPQPIAAITQQSMGAAYAMAEHIPPRLGKTLHLTSTNAFLHGLTIDSYVANAVTATNALTTILFLPTQPNTTVITKVPIPAIGRSTSPSHLLEGRS